MELAELLHRIALLQLDADQNVASDHDTEDSRKSVAISGVARTASKTPRSIR
jgi:hypothetical protein